MQTAQYALAGLGVVVLHKVDMAADNFVELFLVEAFHEKALVIAEYFRFQDQHIIQDKLNYNDSSGFSILCNEIAGKGSNYITINNTPSSSSLLNLANTKISSSDDANASINAVDK